MDSFDDGDAAKNDVETDRVGKVDAAKGRRSELERGSCGREAAEYHNSMIDNCCRPYSIVSK